MTSWWGWNGYRLLGAVMSQLSERALRRTTDPEVAAHIDDITTFWNAGRYQGRVFTAAPTHTGGEGEFLFANLGGTKYIYAYIGGAWVRATMS